MVKNLSRLRRGRATIQSRLLKQYLTSPPGVDILSFGVDVASAVLFLGDIAAAGPTGEGIAPAVALQAFNKSLRGQALKNLLAAAKVGREIHKRWQPGRGFQKEYRIPGFGQADDVNLKRMIVKELKPNNPKAIARGEAQLRRYIRGLEKMHPKTVGQWFGKIGVY